MKVLWKQENINLENCDFRFKENTELPEQILELSNPYQFFMYFLTEELLAKITEETNLYSRQKHPNKPINCTVYDIQKFL